MSPAVEGMSRGQQARRTRVIAAAMSLAADGGYEAVQMRDVAVRADVAMGTIYRYFTSKDHLLAASAVDWVEDLERRVSSRPVRGETPAQQVVEVLGRATRSMQRAPALTASLILAMTSNDRAVVPCQLRIAQVMTDLMSAPLVGVLDDETRRNAVRVLTHVWFSALQGWVNGWGDGGIDVHEELRVAADLLLRPTTG